MIPAFANGRSFDLTAFGLASPRAPSGAVPLSLEEQDDGPTGKPHDRFVIVELHRSEVEAKKAAKGGAQAYGRLSRLLVQLELRGAWVIDARGRLSEMALRHGDPSELDELALLYEQGADLVRILGPEGELVVVFTDAIGQSVLVVDQAIVTVGQPRERLRPAEVVLAVGLAITAAPLWEVLKPTMGPLLAFAVPLWLLLPTIFAAVILLRLSRAVRNFVRQVLHVLEVLEHLADALDTQRAQQRRDAKARR
jgi:hypothetical protein